MPTIDELQNEVDQLKTQQAMQTRALRMILEGHLAGANSAAAQVVALEGGQTTIDVAPFAIG